MTIHVCPCFALGVLEALWHVAAEQTPDGAIGKLTNQDIADEMFYDGDADELIRALVLVRFLDESTQHRLVIHDWDKYADQATKRKVARRGESLVVVSSQQLDIASQQLDTSSPPVPVPVPVPVFNSCSEEPGTASELSPDASLIVFDFPIRGKLKSWHLTKIKVAEYERTYPDLDVLGECRRARQWCIDNKEKRKTAQGMPAFLSRWLTRACDRPANERNGRPADSRPIDLPKPIKL